jgi:hypothetical protein
MRCMVSKTWLHLFRSLSLVCLFFAIASCAGGQARPMHSFEFHAATDSPDVEILDYRYGDSQQPGVRASDWDKSSGRVQMGGGVTSAMLRGDFLYVKWRIKGAERIYEDRVDLKNRLPRDITNHRIYFVVKGPELFVYLITPEANPPDWPTHTPPGYTHKKTLVLYP